MADEADMKMWDGTDTAPTLTANNAGSGQRMPNKENFNCVCGKYIVRRLTETECERLQGFPDGWVSALPDKDDMTDEEVEFWNRARAAEAEMEGKHYKPQNKEQMIRWYNRMIKSSSAQYKALGNSISTGPNSFWKFLVKRISAQYDYDITLGSLFDGIGGFPLIWEQINGKGSARWASEVATFPIAVTLYHFGGD